MRVISRWTRFYQGSLDKLTSGLFLRFFLTWRRSISWPEEVQLSRKLTDCRRWGNAQWWPSLSPATPTHHKRSGLQRELPCRDWQIVRQASGQWGWRGVHGHMYGGFWFQIENTNIGKNAAKMKLKLTIYLHSGVLFRSGGRHGRKLSVGARFRFHGSWPHSASSHRATDDQWQPASKRQEER